VIPGRHGLRSSRASVLRRLSASPWIFPTSKSLARNGYPARRRTAPLPATLKWPLSLSRRNGPSAHRRPRGPTRETGSCSPRRTAARVLIDLCSPVLLIASRSALVVSPSAAAEPDQPCTSATRRPSLVSRPCSALHLVGEAIESGEPGHACSRMRSGSLRRCGACCVN